MSNIHACILREQHSRRLEGNTDAFRQSSRQSSRQGSRQGSTQGSRQGSVGKPTGRTPRNIHRQGGLPAIAAAPQSIAALVRDANDAADDAERLREDIFVSQQQSRRRRMELQQDVSEAVRLDVERSAHEKENLEAQLADIVRNLHTLEQSVVDHNAVTREQKKHARAVASQLRRLGELDVGDTDAVDIQGDGMKALRDVHRQLGVQRQGMDDELQRAYQLKERAEADIGDRRQAAAINEALLRACHDGLMALPVFDDLASTIQDSQVTQGIPLELPF